MSALIIIAVLVVAVLLIAAFVRQSQLHHMDARREEARALRREAQTRDLTAQDHVATAEESAAPADRESRFAREHHDRAREIAPDADGDEAALTAREKATQTSDL